MYHFYLYMSIATIIILCLSKLISMLFMSKEEREYLVDERLKPLYEFRDSLGVEGEIYEINSKLVNRLILIAFCIIPYINIITMYVSISSLITKLLFIKSKHKAISKG